VICTRCKGQRKRSAVPFEEHNTEDAQVIANMKSLLFLVPDKPTAGAG
jgi:hypothetical protein